MRTEQRHAKLTSRKFNPRCDSDKQSIPWATFLRATYGTTAQLKTHLHDTQGLISQFMASLAQIVGENPRHVPWNN